VRAWVDQGADWPVTATVKQDKARDHWAWRAPVRAVVPEVQGPRSKVQSPVDAFIQARLAKEGLEPSPEADHITLLRRLHLDLTGLPPTPAEVDAFLADPRPDAYARKVEE